MLNRASNLDALCGMVGYNKIAEGLAYAAKQSDHIVLNWDSPGGMSKGAEGLSMKIHKLTQTHRVTSLVNNSMYSAAYFAGSAADEIYATCRSDGVGSIGTYLMHVDQSASDTMRGLKVTYISAGEFKTIGNSHEPLSGKSLNYLQKEVNAVNDVFLETVLSNRSRHFSSIEDVRKVAEGQTFLAHEAVANGLIDGIATLEEITGG
jgi:signal peptide peptidase SppA